MLRLAVQNLRHNPLQTLLGVLAIAVEVAVILTMVGIAHGLKLRPDIVRGWIGGFALILLGFVLCVCFATVTVSRYAVVAERTQDIGILMFLGASSSDVHKLLFQETLLIVIPGTILGIAMAYVTKAVTAFVLSDFFTQETVYEWWPIAGGVSALGVLLGGSLPAWKAARQNLVELLSSKDQ